MLPKLTFFLLFALLAAPLRSWCQTSPQDRPDKGPEITTLLDSLESYVTSRDWDAAMIIEDVLGNVPEFEHLRELMPRDWSQVVTLATQPQSSSIRRSIAIAAATALTKDQYRQFLSKALSSAEAGVMTKKEIVWTIFSLSPKLGGFWSDTWQDPLTRSDVQRLRKLFAGDDNMESYCDSLLSGELKRKSDEVGEAMRNPPPTADGKPPVNIDQSSQAAKASATQSIAAWQDHSWMVWLLAVFVALGTVFLLKRKQAK